MLNGKFYTGLTPKMIEKSGGRDHQKTNFFWPDETNLKSVTDNKVRKSLTNNYADTSTHYEPQQLFKKELTSKIQFYDLIDDDFKKNSRNKNECVNINNMKNNDKKYVKTKQPGTLKSEIHDYDYGDGNYRKNERNIKMEKIEIDGNRADLPKLINKKITFNDIENKKVYTKNNDVNKIPSGVKERVGLVNKNKMLSKSVENLPVKLINNKSDNQDEGIKLIENDVKNFKIPFENEDYYDERQYEFNQSKHRDINNASKDFFKYPKEHIAIQDIRRPKYPHRQNYETNYENEKQSSQKNNYSYDKNDYYNHPNEKCNDDYNTTTRHIQIRLSPPREFIQKEKNSLNETTKRHHNLSHKNNSNNDEISFRTDASEQQYINKNRHLRSNILFSDQIDNQPSSAPDRRTIRSSAVNRVSVGLPEF